MADCGLIDVGCQVGNAINDALINLTKSVAASAANLAKEMATFWLAVPSPSLAPGDPTVSFIQGSLYWYTSALALLSVIVAGMRMMWERRSEPGMDLVKSLAMLVLIDGAGLAGLSAAMYAGDAFSKWILERSGRNFGDELVHGLGINDPDINLATAFALLIIAALACVTSLVQIVLLIIRNGFLVLLAGVWPTTAAMTNTEMGLAWFKRATGWLIAYLLYKPVAAVIYATAVQAGTNSGATGGNTTINALSALTLMVMAVLALPALLRFTAPVLSAVASGQGGGAGSAAVAAVATGAMAVSGVGAVGAATTAGASGLAGATGATGAAGAGSAAGAAGAASTGMGLVNAGMSAVQATGASQSGGAAPPPPPSMNGSSPGGQSPTHPTRDPN